MYTIRIFTSKYTCQKENPKLEFVLKYCMTSNGAKLVLSWAKKNKKAQKTPIYICMYLHISCFENSSCGHLFWNNSGNGYLCWNDSSNDYLCWNNSGSGHLCWNDSGSGHPCWNDSGSGHLCWNDRGTVVATSAGMTEVQ